MPPTTTPPQSSTTSGIKLSKLIKEVRTFGCETFFGSVDAVIARNWLKRVFDTLNDMELDDKLKLKVATRLIDKSAEIKKARICLFKNLMSNSTLGFTKIKKMQEFFRLR